MEIIETLVIELESGLLDNLLNLLPAEDIPEQELPVKRIEIDPDLILFLYNSEGQTEIRPEILDRIFPHLKSILILSGNNDISETKMPLGMLDRIKKLKENCPILVAAQLTESENSKLPEAIKKDGLYLTDCSRMIYWDKSNPESNKKIWQALYSNI